MGYHGPAQPDRIAMNVDALIEEEFPQDDALIYLNHAAVAPWPARTARAVRAFAEENVRQGALRYRDWCAREEALRGQLQRLIHAPSADDIALLKNTSEGISLVACGLDWRWGDNVVGSSEEFPSNRIPWEAQRKWGVTWRGVEIDVADPEAALMAACDARTRVLAVSSVQYGSGRRLDIARLGDFCRERGILFCLDAIQSLGALRLDVQAAGVDFAMADAHKWLLGPEGIALFYCRAELRPMLELRQYGWHMVQNSGDFDSREWRPAGSARRFECGSPNMIGIQALSASLSLFEDIGMEEIERRVLDAGSALRAGLATRGDVELLTPADAARRAGIVTFRVAGCEPAELHRRLVARGVICACRGGGVRLSPHFYTGRHRIDRALETVDECI
jgi:cysteine desulfurase/selenocysteine lyase